VIHFYTQPAFKKQEGFLFHSHEQRALDDPSKICPESRVVSRGTKSAMAWLKDGNLSTKSRPKKERKKGSESGISPAPNSAEESHIKSGEDGVSRKMLQSSKIQIFADCARTNAPGRRKGRTFDGNDLVFPAAASASAAAAGE